MTNSSLFCKRRPPDSSTVLSLCGEHISSLNCTTVTVRGVSVRFAVSVELPQLASNLARGRHPCQSAKAPVFATTSFEAEKRGEVVTDREEAATVVRLSARDAPEPKQGGTPLQHVNRLVEKVTAANNQAPLVGFKNMIR